MVASVTAFVPSGGPGLTLPPQLPRLASSAAHQGAGALRGAGERSGAPTWRAADAVAATFAGGLTWWLAGSLRRRGGRFAARCALGAREKSRYSQAPILVSQSDDPEHYWLGTTDSSASQAYSDDQLTKIICTLGPATDTSQKIAELIGEGMDVARFNFSHGDHESQLKILKAFRQAVSETCSPTCRLVATLLDTKGPEIRTGMTANKEKVKYTRGDVVTVTSDYTVLGDSKTVALSYPKFPTLVRPGQPVRIGDGALNLEVTDVSGAAAGSVQAVVMNDATIGDRKNCNIPGLRVDLPLLQEKDKKDLLEFALPYGFDYIALSFVQDAESVRGVRELLKKNCPLGKSPPQLIAKIENAEGLKNLDEIIQVCDGIMVARGDLGMEIPPERVFLAQKMAIAKCNLAGKFVITATQMLESMTNFPRPTRAEASDVANSVLDGTDCVMLSGETAAGSFPIESARMMVQICREAERHMDFTLTYERMAEASKGSFRNADEAICNSAVRLAIDSGASMILALTSTGFTPRHIAKFKPPVPICAVAPTEEVCRGLSLVRGVVALRTEFDQADGTGAIIDRAVAEAKGFGIVSAGDTIVVVHRTLDDQGRGFTNLVRAMPVK